MSKEYWFPIGEKIKQSPFYEEMRMKIKQLDRDGFCGHCTQKIHKRKEYVLTYQDHHNKMPRIVLCQDCIKEMIKIFDDFNSNELQGE